MRMTLLVSSASLLWSWHHPPRSYTWRPPPSEVGTEERWDAVVEATVDLANAYESLGPRVEGSADGTLIAKD